MKTISLLNELGYLGFKAFICVVNNNHLQFSSKVDDKPIFINIMICATGETPRYMTTLQVDGQDIINEILSPEDKFDLIIQSIKTHVKEYQDGKTNVDEIKKNLEG